MISQVTSRLNQKASGKPGKPIPSPSWHDHPEGCEEVVNENKQEQLGPEDGEAVVVPLMLDISHDLWVLLSEFVHDLVFLISRNLHELFMHHLIKLGVSPLSR
jgi:hypothetical protein